MGTLEPIVRQQAADPAAPGAIPDRERPRRFRRFLKGTYHHFSAYLPWRLPSTVRAALAFLFRKCEITAADREAIRAAATRGPILYVARDRSLLEFLAIGWVLARHELPRPVFAHYLSLALVTPLLQTLRRTLAIAVHYIERGSYPNPYRSDFLGRLFSEETPSLLFVTDFRGMPRRFGSPETDVLTEIFRVQRDVPRPIQVVPVAFIHGRRPDREIDTLADLVFGPTAEPGLARRLWTYLRYRRDCAMRVGAVDSLDTMVRRMMPRNMLSIDRPAELAYRVRRDLIEKLDQERRAALGPIRRTRTEIVEAALHNRRLVGFVREYARDHQKSFVETRARARRYLDEMAADYSPAMIAFADVALRWMFRLGKGQIHVDAGEIDRIRPIARRMPIVYVPSHRSHMDYLLVSYVLYQHRLSLPFILSGINLNFWPVGPMFRRCGAFFLRRAFKGKRIYSRTVAVYIETLLREGFNIEFFIEGGRSRIGKILPPKAGFISILLAAFRESGRADVAFVPVTIDYERVFEEDVYVAEAADRKKSDGKKWRFALRNRRMLGRRIGDIHIAFGEPRTLADILADEGRAAVPDDRAGQMHLARSIGYRLTWEIRRNFLIRPHALVATILLANPRRGTMLPDFARDMTIFLNHLRRHAELPAGEAWDDPEWNWRAVELAVRQRWARVETGDGDEDMLILLDEDRRMPLTIQRNGLVRLYQDEALVSVALNGAAGPITEDVLWQRFLFARDVMTGEMIHGPSPDPTVDEAREAFARTVAVFRDAQFVVDSAHGLTPTASGTHAVRIFAAPIAAYMESYYIVARTLRRSPGARHTEKEWVRQAMKQGRMLHSVGEVLYAEAVHKTHFETALRRFGEMGYVTREEIVGEKSRVDRFDTAAGAEAIEGLLANLRPFLT
ncbi:1-acyl-sn-glycerol-3-phosphate acyltransferase [bacterium]|nr:1-acyl-sn-glycerol-3-phosphate acyltransferase [bacterium]